MPIVQSIASEFHHREDAVCTSFRVTIFTQLLFLKPRKEKKSEQKKHIKIKIESTLTTLLILTRKLPRTLLLWLC